MATLGAALDSKAASPAQHLVFPPFRLDRTNECLWEGMQRLPLTHKSYRVLEYLVENAGRPVPKDELLDAVWPDTFVGDAVLKVCVAELRKALRDPAQEPRYIQTLHRRGYCFVGRTDRPPASPGSLVERETALERLLSALSATIGGQRQIVFVTGEAGIGKTTLVEAFLASARCETVRIAQVQCLDQHGPGEPYFPLLEALTDLSRHQERERFTSLLRQHAPTWLAELPSLVAPGDRDLLRRESMGAAKERMVREFGALVEAITEEAPLILLLEDLHWSDASSIDVIAHLVRRKQAPRLLLLATYRPEELILRDHSLRRLKLDLQMHGSCTEVALEFLSVEGIVQLLEQSFQDCSWVGELAVALHRRTDGNPWLTVNVIDLLVSTGAIVEQGGTWEVVAPIAEIAQRIPETVREMIDRQFERMGEREQALLSAACVVGWEFSIPPLTAALGSDPVTVEELCESLARGRQWIQALNTAQGRYRFIHALYQHALYLGVPVSRRVRLHLRIGQYLEGAHSAGSNESPVELAAHFEAGRDHARAVMYLVRCSQFAARRNAAAEAVAHLDRGFLLLNTAPADQRVRLEARILEQRGLVKRSMDDIPGAAMDFQSLEEHAALSDDLDLQVRALVRLSGVLFWRDHRRCLEAAHRAVSLSNRADQEWLMGQAAGYLSSRTLRLTGWREEDFENCRKAANAARTRGDHEFLGLHLMSLSNFYCHRAQYAEACEAADEGMELMLEAGDAYHYVSCQFFKSWALLHSGGWDRAVPLMREAHELAQQNGHRTAAAFLRVLEAWLHLEVFDDATATVLAEGALEQAGKGFARLLALIVKARASARLDRWDVAQSCFQEVTRGGHTMDWAYNFPLQQALGEFHMARGKWEDAVAAADRLAAYGAQSRQATYLGIAQYIRAEALWRCGEKTHLVLEDAESPLAGWRLQLIAARIAADDGRIEAADRHRFTAISILEGLADSLAAYPPLASALRNHITLI
ncbi:MAG TPA: AAA family ATPase [Bryobacteraceae bacterium]|nr:AAA family ATPase [Bryobacteraceae bacterium]